MMKVYSKSIEVLRGLGEVASRIGLRDADLARQLRRAGASVPLNVAEAEHGLGRRQKASFAVAMGSARECRACIDVSVALGYVDEVDDELRDDLDHVIAMLYRLSR